MGKGGDDPNCSQSVGMAGVLSTEKDVAAKDIAPALDVLFSMSDEERSWIPSQIHAELEEALIGNEHNHVDRSSIAEIVRRLGIREGSDKYDAIACITTRWMRANGFTKGGIRSFLRHHLGPSYHPDTLEKWCQGVAFQLPWASRTSAQPLRDGPEEYEAQRRRWLQIIGSKRDLVRRTRIGTRRANAYRKQAQQELEKEIYNRFHKIALFKVGGPDGELVEKLFSNGAIDDLVEEIAHKHVRYPLSEHKP